MPDGERGTFLPLKFDFQGSSDGNHFYIYSIWNSQKDKYYIGISRTPNERIKQSLGITKQSQKPNKKRKELYEDYKNAVERYGYLPTEEFPIKFGILNKDGYPNAFLGCIAEVLHMIKLEDSGKHLYNQNKFGGHAELGSYRSAFEAIVKIIDPSLKGHPSDREMRELEKYAYIIKSFAKETDNRTIIEQSFLSELETAWDEHLKRQKKDGFGRKKKIPLIAFGDEYFPLNPIPANDNSPETDSLNFQTDITQENTFD